jgi:hypothetical protein
LAIINDKVEFYALFVIMWRSKKIISTNIYKPIHLDSGEIWW